MTLRKNISANEIRRKYLRFFRERGHEQIPSASLLPENDATTLFVGSGMQPLVPYLLGKDHPQGRRLVNSQRCFRAEDIEEVGDNRHSTFFEMLGNWSLGDYFKKEQLRWIWEFLTEEVGLDPERIYVTCFAGDDRTGIDRDEESAEIWRELFAEKGIEAPIKHIGSARDGSRLGMGRARIFYYDAGKNWWSRAGRPEKMPPGEIGGPDSEIFYDFAPSGSVRHDGAFGENCHPNCDCGRFVEIGNSVFMQFVKNSAGGFDELPRRNVDFGGGLERMAAAAIDNPDIFRIDLFAPILRALEKASGESYGGENRENFRLVADHLRAAVFMIGDGLVPSNKEQGYVLRRLLRRGVRRLHALSSASSLADFVAPLLSAYDDEFRPSSENEKEIVSVVAEEEDRFRRTLSEGLRKLRGALSGDREKDCRLLENSDLVFDLFQSFGFPPELTLEEVSRVGLEPNKEKIMVAFEKRLREHRNLSRAGAAEKFAGGLADKSERTTALHTATHLMLAGLRKYLGPEVFQKGSNITAERARFDFSYPEKVPAEILRKVEEYVNEAIAAEAEVKVEKMSKEKARAEGVLGAFWDKYPETVDVYTVLGRDGTVYSRELCGGPHVKNTREIGGRFKIIKEQSSGAGVRRIKAIIA